MIEDSLSPPEALQVHLEGFEGPLDLLLALARRQQVDLANISIVALVDQYVAAVAAMDRVDLARAVEWLVMAAWLTWLKSRLLLPRELEGSSEADEAAQVLTDRLAGLERIRTTATWLEARPQLGRDIFERGRPEMIPGPTVAADVLSLFHACLDVLQSYGGRAPEAYRPPRRLFWMPHQAMARIQAILGLHPNGCDLLSFLPAMAANVRGRTIHLRAAISSTLIAGLELARDAQLDLQQEMPFDRIMVRPQIAAPGEDVAPETVPTA